MHLIEDIGAGMEKAIEVMVAYRYALTPKQRRGPQRTIDQFTVRLFDSALYGINFCLCQALVIAKNHSNLGNLIGICIC